MSSLNKTQLNYFSGPVPQSDYKQSSQASRSKAILPPSAYNGARKAAITMIAVGVIAVIGTIICAVLLHGAFPQDAFLNALSQHHWTILGIGGGLIALGAGASLVIYYKDSEFRKFSDGVDNLYNDQLTLEETRQQKPISFKINPFAAHFADIKSRLKDAYDLNQTYCERFENHEKSAPKYVTLKPGDSFSSLTIDYKEGSGELRRGFVRGLDKVMPQGQYVLITKDEVKHFSKAKHLEAEVNGLQKEGYQAYDLR